MVGCNQIYIQEWNGVDCIWDEGGNIIFTPLNILTPLGEDLGLSPEEVAAANLKTKEEWERYYPPQEKKEEKPVEKLVTISLERDEYGIDYIINSKNEIIYDGYNFVNDEKDMDQIAAANEFVRQEFARRMAILNEVRGVK